MTVPYIPPSYEKAAFNCPHCGAFATQIWGACFIALPNRSGSRSVPNADMAKCAHCEKGSLWINKEFVWPESLLAAPPNPDLAEEIQADFNEARSIIQRSPRGACALLRLCLQKLCIQLGLPGRNINDDIKVLVARGLTPGVQKGLDAIRIIGNSAVHPGEIDLQNNQETAIKLCGIINYIADFMISSPKQAAALFNELPESARKAVERRDGNATAPVL